MQQLNQTGCLSKTTRFSYIVEFIVINIIGRGFIIL